jgi:hypothetical protein
VNFPAAARSPASLAGDGMASDGIVYDVFRHRLEEGVSTTVYVVRYPRDNTRVRVQHFPRLTRLDRWCRWQGVEEALVGGFFVRPHGPALGEVWVAGKRVETRPFRPPFDHVRAAVSIEDGAPTIAPRNQLHSRPDGDLLQAGPLLIAGARTIVDDEDPEGFSATADQFDSDITAGRYPRTALGLSDEHLLAVACDGRGSNGDCGLTLHELAQLMLELGAHSGINLDGGGSSALVHGGRRRNRPYESQAAPVRGGRPVATALVFNRR